MCQINLQQGFALWRSIFSILSVFITCIVLTVELIFNDILIKIRHILLPILFFICYVGVSALQSSLMKEPVYGLNLSYSVFITNNALFDWPAKFAANLDNCLGLQRIQYCREYYNSISPMFLQSDSEIQPDYRKTGITLSVMGSSMILGHVLISLITKFSKTNYTGKNEMQMEPGHSNDSYSSQ
jgi:hypothetical protein